MNMDMEYTIVAALITGILAVIGSYAGNVAIARKKDREDAIRDAEREARQAIRLDSIEKKLDEHNGYAEKFGEIQKDIAIVKTKMEHLEETIK